MTIALLVTKRGLSSTIAGPPILLCIDTVTQAATEIVKDRNVLNFTEAAEALHLSPLTMDAQKAVLLAIKTMCCFHNESFQNLCETLELEGIENLVNSVSLSLFNPPYDVRHQNYLQNRGQDVFAANEMEAFCESGKIFWSVEGMKNSFVAQYSFTVDGGVSRLHESGEGGC